MDPRFDYSDPSQEMTSAQRVAEILATADDVQLAGIISYAEDQLHGNWKLYTDEERLAEIKEIEALQEGLDTRIRERDCKFVTAWAEKQSVYALRNAVVDLTRYTKQHFKRSDRIEVRLNRAIVFAELWHRIRMHQIMARKIAEDAWAAASVEYQEEAKAAERRARIFWLCVDTAPRIEA